MRVDDVAGSICQALPQGVPLAAHRGLHVALLALGGGARRIRLPHPPSPLLLHAHRRSAQPHQLLCQLVVPPRRARQKNILLATSSNAF